VGGLGSGKDWSMKKKTTSRCLRLDIRRLWRDNLLKAGQAFTVRWSRRAEVRGSISISVEENVIILGHDRLQSDGTWQDEQYRVSVDWTACNYAGLRPWFRCPTESCELIKSCKSDGENKEDQRIRTAKSGEDR
jgi:hypothetical protein